MHQRVIDALQGEAQAIEKARAKIASLKESFQVRTKDLKEDARNWVH